ncbi:MAG: HAD-IA family hydrolase [Polynucleobacter sp.]
MICGNINNNDVKTVINLSNYRVVLFDLDGTIAETEMAGHLSAFNAAFACHNINWCWDASEYKKLLKIAGGFERLKHYQDKFLSAKSSTIVLDDELLKKLHQTKNDIYAKLIKTGVVQPRPGFVELIKKIWMHDKEWGVVTTTSTTNWLALWDSSIKDKIDLFPKVIICGEDVSQKKPSPEAYLLAAKKLGVNPNSCLAIEDSSNGIRAANAAGMDVIGVKSHFFSDDDLTPSLAVVDSLTSIEFSLKS